MLKRSIFRQPTLLWSVWSAIWVFQSLRSAVTETNVFFGIPFPTLSNQERELHKEGVLSAPSWAGSRISLLTDNGVSGEATDSSAQRNGLHDGTSQNKPAEQTRKENCQGNDSSHAITRLWRGCERTSNCKKNQTGS